MDGGYWQLVRRTTVLLGVWELIIWLLTNQQPPFLDEGVSDALTAPALPAMLNLTGVPCDVAYRQEDVVLGGLTPAESRSDIASYRVTYLTIDNRVHVVGDDEERASSVILPSGVSFLHIGSPVVLGNRCLVITSYADEGTERWITLQRQSTLALIKPDALSRAGLILSALSAETQLTVAGLRLLTLTEQQAEELYTEHKERDFHGPLMTYMRSGPVMALHLVGPDAVSAWRSALGPTDPIEARRTAPQSLRAMHGTDKQRNAAHGSDRLEAARREVSLFFPVAFAAPSLPHLPSTAELLDDTSCLVLPHIVAAGELGAVLTRLRDSHDSEPSRAEMVRLGYEEGRRYASGVVLPGKPASQDLLHELLSHPSVFLKLQSTRAQETQAQFARRFKDIIGIRDPVRARKTFPESLRAEFGENEHTSAVLCPHYDFTQH